MTTGNYNNSTGLRNAIQTAIQLYVEWKHISRSKTKRRVAFAHYFVIMKL